MATYEYGQQIWNGYMAIIKNEYGVAGLMGNQVAESGLIPYRVQGDNTPPYTFSQNYTLQVDNGTISENDFVHNSPNGGGYGLSQWTYYTRKQTLYDWHIQRGVSIGDVKLAIDYTLYELQTNYQSVYNILTNATSIKEASDAVLHDYENPAEQGPEVEDYRASLGRKIYNLYSSTSPYSKLPIWLYFQFNRRW